MAARAHGLLCPFSQPTVHDGRRRGGITRAARTIALAALRRGLLIVGRKMRKMLSHVDHPLIDSRT